jgi:hypothetical protein
MRLAIVALLAFTYGVSKMPLELAANSTSTVPTELVRPGERLSQSGVVALLGGLRSIVADVLYIQAHVAWERTEWSRMLTLFREATALQPRATLFWDTAAWHMAWNASTAALNDPAEPKAAMRTKRQREFIYIGKDFLERGIRYNPDQPQLYEALARLQRDKLHDHAAAADAFAKAAVLPGAAAYDERFAAYELSYADGHEREAYLRLRALYDRGERERLPTLIARIHALEDKLSVPPNDRIPR